MDNPVIAARKPVLVTLKAGRPVLWCSCGRSKRQPYCDGSHAGSDFEPVKFVPDRDGEVLLCACKRTKSQPICDGSHNNLGDANDYAASLDEVTPDAEMIEWTERSPGFAAAGLDNGCYVARVSDKARSSYGALSLAPVILNVTGAKYLSYYTGSLASGHSDILRFSGSDVAIFAVDGAVSVDIGGRQFELHMESGIGLKPGEAFQLLNKSDHAVRLEFAVCPETTGLETLALMPDCFDAHVPDRVVHVDVNKREVMADRFYQVLVDQRQVGSPVTQFIGEVPRSRAKHHRHLYEEVILVLRGEGVMWTDHTKALVQAGDVIFLPKSQAHSLEATSKDGMRLMGVFFPSGSPAVNY